MVSITRAEEKDAGIVASLGMIAVGEAHKDSAPPEDMNAYLQKNYNLAAMEEELRNRDNIYFIIYYNDQPAGFSKIVLNTPHPNIAAQDVTKLDRIYLLSEFFGLKLGLQLLNYNIAVAKENSQSGIWLFTWVKNERAIAFYEKAGFEIVGSHEFYVTPTHFNLNHQMYLQL